MTGKNVSSSSSSPVSVLFSVEARAGREAVLGAAGEKDLFDWLHSLELTHHFDKFLDHGYEDLEICMEIGEADLHAIGVSDIHERLALLQSVRQLRQEQEMVEKERQQQQQQQERNNSKKLPKKKSPPKSLKINNNNNNNSGSKIEECKLAAISPLVDSSLSYNPPFMSSMNLGPTWNYPPSVVNKGLLFKGNNNNNTKNKEKGRKEFISMQEFLVGSNKPPPPPPLISNPSLPLRNGLPPNSYFQGSGLRFEDESDNRNYVEVTDDEDEVVGVGVGGCMGGEPVYESVSPVPEGYRSGRLLGCRSTPITPKRFQQSSAIRFDSKPEQLQISGLSQSAGNNGSHSAGCEGGGFCYGNDSIPPPPLPPGGAQANLARLRAQLRDQVLQDGINISRISDEGMLRSMAAQYAAELASTLTLTPSSTSACSTSSDSSCNSNCSNASSSSAQTPGDQHYQQVLGQLRELWIEERMKQQQQHHHQHLQQQQQFHNPPHFLPTTECTCGDPNMLNARTLGFKSSSSSTPAATTPNGHHPFPPELILMTSHHPSSSGVGGGGGGGPALLHAPRSVPNLFSNSNNGLSHNSSSHTNINNLMNNNGGLIPPNSICKSPERGSAAAAAATAVGQQHQYLQHVIISNNSFPPHPSINNPGGGGTTTNGSSPSKAGLQPKITYKPGIYLPSSCLIDKDEIYDYAPPVRISPKRVNNYSPSKRCFTQPKGVVGGGGGGRNSGQSGNSNSTLARGSSKSSYALASSPSSSSSCNANSIYGANFENFGGSKQGGVKPCRTITNLSKLSRRLGLGRFFRTLKVHGNGPNNPNNAVPGRQSSGRLPNHCKGGSEDGAISCGCLEDNNCRELMSEGFCQCPGGRSTLPDLTLNSRMSKLQNSANEKTSMSSLPSNERIIQTINRLKLEELEKRKERIAQEHQMVRETLFYMLPGN